ncbi:uncharacterized protein BDR25DRAFT_307899 [Lindgomyces ingoldianus]|uniref:Uncharacterized protein n=1 Tax=Lindgomyces ingoldianus TaxID=673940 RepID=A0ACB6Q8D2_9PLEO|nr:uncharacterized protein BDR25DRAFT_307899 [Lindgomyces ingoldianus]KAF2463136.1 hypothetical protein BDR25DRAFT_307899 [Lindgomyces ingoldianus]
MPSPSSEPDSNSPIFSPTEESALLTQSHSEKASANKTFTSGDYSSAIQGYEKALSLCPAYLEYDIAVLQSNISACHLKLQEWKSAVEAATLALEALERVEPPSASATNTQTPGKDGDDSGSGRRKEHRRLGQQGEAVEKEAAVEVDDATEARILALTRTGHTLHTVHKLRTKALLRRAKARREVGGWSSLQGSLEDYQILYTPPLLSLLSSLDLKIVQAALRELPPRLEDAKGKEMAEMIGKLKELGNGILKPFGLSTENFQFTKDEKSGGYSMGFNQNGGC